MPASLARFVSKDSVWFFDIDDTLVDFSGTVAIATERVHQVLQTHFSVADAQKVTDRFNHFFLLQKRVHQSHDNVQDEEHDTLAARINDIQQDIYRQYGFVKQWSREVLLKLAADDLGVQVTPELVHEAIDAYWVALSQESHLLPGSKELLLFLEQHNQPVYLLTSSDGRLTMNDDHTFSYSPEYSAGLKRERIELLRQKGIFYRGMSIGDPEDKPHRDFFEKGIRIAETDLGRAIDLSHAVMVGDSYSADLQTPKEQLGFGLTILLSQQVKDSTWVDERQLTTNTLASIPRLLPSGSDS